MNIDKKRFFDCFRTYHKSARGKSLVQSQVRGLSFLLDQIENDHWWVSLDQVAYFLATVAHETAWTFEPIKEYRGKTLSAAQKKYWPSGYYGRGYIQLTWEKNYQSVGGKLGINLEGQPELALEPKNAYEIAARGMREGWFTGKKLSNYINTRGTDYRNARRIVNGVDKAAHIAIIAANFQKCLNASLVADRGAVSDTGVGEAGELPPVLETPPPTNTELTATSVTSKTTTTQTDDAEGKTKTVTEETPSLATRIKTSTTFAQSVGINVSAIGAGIFAFLQSNYRVMIGTGVVIVLVFAIYSWREAKRGK